MRGIRTVTFLLIGIMGFAARGFAEQPSREVFLPAIARASTGEGAWSTNVWVTNLGAQDERITTQFFLNCQ